MANALVKLVAALAVITLGAPGSASAFQCQSRPRVRAVYPRPGGELPLDARLFVAVHGSPIERGKLRLVVGRAPTRFRIHTSSQSSTRLMALELLRRPRVGARYRLTYKGREVASGRVGKALAKDVAAATPWVRSARVEVGKPYIPRGRVSPKRARSRGRTLALVALERAPEDKGRPLAPIAAYVVEVSVLRPKRARATFWRVVRGPGATRLALAALRACSDMLPAPIRGSYMIKLEAVSPTGRVSHPLVLGGALR
ncbi:MAG: hypothetical protein KC503_33515 [Myxococcales bacterium]|nr:hypothetical protein [Myxococcales bacterium]